jgi:hypothetical protein
MKKMNRLITSAAVLALVSFASIDKASAQFFNGGDLMLDFRINNNNNADNVMVDLGSVTSFNFSANNSSVLNLGADLTTVYGSSFATNSHLVFSLVAELPNGASNNIYISNPGNAQHFTGFNPLGSGGNASAIIPIYNEQNGTALTATNAWDVTPSSSDSSSYTDVLTNVNKDNASQPYNNDYGFVSGAIGTTEQGIGGTTDLYQQTPTHTSTDLGTFSVTSAGVLTFTAPVAVPEPASYVLGGIAAVLFVIMHRRSKIQA